MKIQDIYNLNEGLGELLDKELPISSALKLKRASTVVSQELKNAEDLRTKIVKKYQDVDNGDGTASIKQDKLEDFQKEYNELMEQDIDMNVAKIKPDELGDIEVKPKTLNLIESILDAE